MRLVLQTDDGKTIDTYEEIDQYDLDDPDSPFGLMVWLKKSIKIGKRKRTAPKKQEWFVITRLHRDDLKEVGINAKNWPDDKMERLAGKMANDYLEQLHWSSLRDLAEYI
jgi:hypothetical protein